MRTFQIISNHDVYVDNYEQGELKNVNWYKLDSIVSANNIKVDYGEVEFRGETYLFRY